MNVKIGLITILLCLFTSGAFYSLRGSHTVLEPGVGRRGGRAERDILTRRSRPEVEQEREEERERKRIRGIVQEGAAERQAQEEAQAREAGAAGAGAAMAVEGASDMRENAQKFLQNFIATAHEQGSVPGGTFDFLMRAVRSNPHFVRILASDHAISTALYKVLDLSQRLELAGLLLDPKMPVERRPESREVAFQIFKTIDSGDRTEIEKRGWMTQSFRELKAAMAEETAREEKGAAAQESEKKAAKEAETKAAQAGARTGPSIFVSDEVAKRENMSPEERMRLDISLALVTMGHPDAPVEARKEAREFLQKLSIENFDKFLQFYFGKDPEIILSFFAIERGKSGMLYDALTLEQRLDVCNRLLFIQEKGEPIIARIFKTIKPYDLFAIVQNHELYQAFNELMAALPRIENKETREIISAKILEITKLLNDNLQDAGRLAKRGIDPKLFLRFTEDFLIRAMQSLSFDQLGTQETKEMTDIIKNVLKIGDFSDATYIFTVIDRLAKSAPKGHGKDALLALQDMIMPIIMRRALSEGIPLVDWPLIMNPLLDRIGTSNFYDNELIKLVQKMNAPENFRKPFESEITPDLAKILPTILRVLDHLVDHQVAEAYTAHDELLKNLRVVKSILRKKPIGAGFGAIEKAARLESIDAFIGRLEKRRASFSGIGARLSRTELVKAFDEWWRSSPRTDYFYAGENDARLFGLRKIEPRDQYTEKETRAAVDTYYELYKLLSESPEKRKKLVDAFYKILNTVSLSHWLVSKYIESFDDQSKIDALMPFYMNGNGLMGYNSLENGNLKMYWGLLHALQSTDVIKKFRQDSHPSLFISLIRDFDRLISSGIDESKRKLIKQMLPILINEIQLALDGKVPYEYLRGDSGDTWKRILVDDLKTGKNLLTRLEKEEKEQKAGAEVASAGAADTGSEAAGAGQRK